MGKILGLILSATASHRAGPSNTQETQGTSLIKLFSQSDLGENQFSVLTGGGYFHKEGITWFTMPFDLT